MKSIILQQKAERDKLLEMRYQERFAMAQAVSYRDSRPIKLITGPRRAGKSVLALQMLKGQNFAYLNFDDAALLEMFDENDVEQALGKFIRTMVFFSWMKYRISRMEPVGGKAIPSRSKSCYHGFQCEHAFRRHSCGAVRKVS